MIILILVVYLSWNTFKKCICSLWQVFWHRKGNWCVPSCIPSRWTSNSSDTLTTLSSSWLLSPALVLSTLSFLWWAKRNTLLLLYPLPGYCGLHWFYLHYHSYGEQRETHSYCFILFLATVACSSFIYTIILMVSKEKHTLIALSSSWLLWPVVVLSTLSFLWWAKRNTLLLLYPLPGYCGL